MAMSTSSSSSSSSPPPSRATAPSGSSSRPALPTNPTPLSAAQEAAVRDLYHKRVRAHCAEEIKAFAQCAVGRTFTTTWKCRREKLTMNGCMIAAATQQEEDAARAEWFALGEQRRLDREHEKEQKRRYEQFQQKWWGDYREGKREGEG